VFLDLLNGVGIGLTVSIIYILTGNLKNSYFFHKEEYEKGETIRIRLSEEVSFLNKASLRETLDHLPEESKVVIDASNTTYIDFDVIELIKEFKEIKAPLKNIDCELLNFKDIYQINNNFVSSKH
jgi:carbonic anhydrase